jgi:predicted outer membrane repeat protein
MITRNRISSLVLHLLVTLSLLAGSAIFPSPAHADSVITVATNADTIALDGLCSLREAIENANNDAQTHSDCVAGSGNDVIQFDDILGTATITLTSNLPNISDPDGLTINGGGDITVSGNDTYRLFFVSSGALALLDGLTITHGIKPNAFSSSPTNNNGTLIVTNSIFSNHVSALHGGGIFNTGTLDITNSIFTNNSAVGAGGAIANSGGVVNIRNSTFTNNIAASGAGIYNDNTGLLTLTNATFFDNTSTNYGGGIYSTGSTTIRNSTFASNSAGSAGTDIYYSNFTAQTLSLYNNILANSDTSAGNCTLNAGSAVGNNNLIEDATGSCGLVHGVNGNIIGFDPNLGALTGSPAFLPLNTGSPAIDAGDDAVCAAAPINNESQNGVTRPQGGHCDIGSFEYVYPILTTTLKSVNTNDGWILESTETSGNGGTLNSATTTFNLGDDAANKQYRAILHFDTSSLPDTAVITSATLKIKKQGGMGTDPFTLLGDLKASVRKPAFGAATLALSDFKSAPGKNNVATFSNIPVSSWYSALVNNTGRVYINRTGTTQFRLAFTTDDNNDNAADLIKFYSGDAGAANRPQLIIEYYVP